MPLFQIETFITGKAYGEVIADSAEEAKEKFFSGEAEMNINEWDTCIESYRGGFLSITEETK